MNQDRAITPTVAGVAQIPTNLPHLRFPLEWFNHIRLPDGKPALNAMAVLSDTVFWYQPKEVIDPRSNQVIGFERKFSGDLLQRSYADYEKAFGFSIPQSRYALDILEEIGVARREVRTRVEIVTSDGVRKVLSNVMYIDLVVQKLYEITVPEALRLMYPMGGGLIYRSDPLIYRSDPLCYTDQTYTDNTCITESIPHEPNGTLTKTFEMPGMERFQDRRLLSIQTRLAEAAKVGLTAITLREAAEEVAKVYGVTAMIGVDDAEYAKVQEMAISLAGLGIRTPAGIQALYQSWMKENDMARKNTVEGTLPKPPMGKQLIQHGSWLKQEGRLNDAGDIKPPAADVTGNNGTRHRGQQRIKTGVRGERTQQLAANLDGADHEQKLRALSEWADSDDDE